MFLKTKILRRLIEVADFLYSSNSAEDIPLRITMSRGMAGWDLTKDEFIELIFIFLCSEELEEELWDFVNRKIGE